MRFWRLRVHSIHWQATPFVDVGWCVYWSPTTSRLLSCIMWRLNIFPIVGTDSNIDTRLSVTAIHAVPSLSRVGSIRLFRAKFPNTQRHYPAKTTFLLPSRPYTDGCISRSQNCLCSETDKTESTKSPLFWTQRVRSDWTQTHALQPELRSFRSDQSDRVFERTHWRNKSAFSCFNVFLT